MRNYNPGIEHGFCLICGNYPCNGIGDGMNIPDHEPDYDSVSVGDSISYICDICGEPIQSQDLISLVINCRGEDHDFLDIDYCLDCTESKILPLLQPERRKILEDTIKKLRDPYNPNQEDYEEY